MKVFFILLLVLFSSSAFGADSRLPQIVCRDARGQSFPLKLDRFAIEIGVYQDLAETTFTLTFRNDTNRQLEGDFLLPLPPTAQISGYALEVNGAFREAVAVEKERAKLAYESIKRRGVDPGIVEKEADNLYRTRIFPIEPESTKSVRISYLEYLPVEAHGNWRPTYRYPFNLTSKVGEISIRILNPSQVTVSHSEVELDFLTADDAEEAALRDSTLSGELTIEANFPHQSQILLPKKSQGDLAYLTIGSLSKNGWGGTPEEPKAPQRPTPRKIKILWDASRSMNGTDFSKAFAYLDAFFAKVAEVEVQLQLLRNQPSPPQTFKIAKGDWSKLKTELENVTYDGSSYLTAMGGYYHNLTLLFTDGQATQWEKDIETITLGNPLIALTTDASLPTNPILRNLTHKSGGQLIPLGQSTAEQACERTFHESFHIGSSQKKLEFIPLQSTSPYVYRYLIKGRKPDPTKFILMVGEQPRGPLPVVKSNSSSPAKLLKKLSGITTLARLEAEQASPSEIITHCKEHTLVSDHTSLIVLEEFNDHLRYRIPPPEKDLLARYRKVLEERSTSKNSRLKRIWAQNLDRHRYQYPGVDYSLHEPLKRIATLNAAHQQVFEPKDIDPKVSTALQGWEQEASDLIKKIRGQKPDAQLIQQIAALNKKAITLGKIQADPKVPFAVSVRGHVQKPDTYQFKEATTLKTAAAQAIPLDPDYLSTVALYRSGEKTIYNTLSKQFVDFPLLPGDMVVLEEGLRSYMYDGFADPFASDPFATTQASDLSSEPAIVEAPETYTNPQQKVFLGDLSEGQPFGARRNNGGGGSQNFSNLDPVPIALKALTLHDEGKEDEAELHLSNLRELFPHNIPALRLEAFVRNQWNPASDKLYRELLARNPSDFLTTQLYTRSLSSREKQIVAKKIFAQFFGSLSDQGDLRAAMILCSDRNQLLKNPSGIAELAVLPKDLRIVVTNLHPDPSFRLTITDPLACTTSRGQYSPTGVTLVNSIGLSEISDREALPGSYHLKANCQRQQLLEVVTYKYFGTPDEETIHKLIILNPGKGEQTLETIVFE